ncbi:MAG: hypothetical protein ACI90V_011683, partial [Bacillariaceae sp.]
MGLLKVFSKSLLKSVYLSPSRPPLKLTERI